MRALLSLVLVSVVGCSDDPAPAVDAPTGGGSDAPNNEAMCLVKANHGNVGTVQGNSNLGPTSLSVVLDAGPPRDNFFINLKGTPATGTFEITGANASGTTCTVCLAISADIVAMQGPTKFYFANSGSVTLTATNPPAGTLSNVTFVETTANGTPTNSGCGSKIEAMTFSE